MGSSSTPGELQPGFHLNPEIFLECVGAKAEDRRNFELGLVSEDPELLDEVQALFHTVWQGDACGTCERRRVCHAPLDSIAA